LDLELPPSSLGNARRVQPRLSGLRNKLSLQPNMQLARSLLTLVLLATTVASTPAGLRVNNDPEYQLQLVSDDLDLNLQEMRLVQTAPDTEPVWMSELEKVLLFSPLWTFLMR
jgi:hypothetical protein